MKKQTIYKIIICVISAILMIGILYYANCDRPRYTITEDSGTEYEVARVIRVYDDNTMVDEEAENIVRGSMKREEEIVSGRYKGQHANTTNFFGAINNVIVKEGDKVTVRIDTLGKEYYEVNIYNYYRTPVIVCIVILFLAALILIGGK